MKRIQEILERAENLGLIDKWYDRMTCSLDLFHCQTELDIDALLSFDDSSFAHDISGIARHISRPDGNLLDCFSPRCAAVYHKESA